MVDATEAGAATATTVTRLQVAPLEPFTALDQQLGDRKADKVGAQNHHGDFKTHHDDGEQRPERYQKEVKKPSHTRREYADNRE